MGVPLITGPISVFTAIENGADFARHAAVGNLIGQMSTCLFCVAYIRAARLFNPWLSVTAGVAVFIIATVIWNQVSWSFAAAIASLVAVLLVLTIVLKPANVEAIGRMAPRWDLLVRMIVSACFVVLITLLTRHLGSQLSGLIAPFPVFVLILAVFTHVQNGRAAATNLLRGVIIGSFPFAAFFSAVFLMLPDHSLPVSYGIAVAASITVSALTYLAMRRQARALRASN